MKYTDGEFNTVCPRDCYGVCELKVTLTNGQVTKVKGHDNNNNSDGKLCVKGASYVNRLYSKERLQRPLVKDKTTGRFDEITWEEALNLIKIKLDHYKTEEDTEAVFYLSGWGHTGAFNNYATNFWGQYGNISTAYGSLCMAAGKAGVKYTYGNLVKHHNNHDLQNANLIIVWGANPANTNIHRMRNIKKAVQKGAKLIVIDPRVSETMIEGAVRIHPKGGTDGLLAMGVAKLLIENHHCDMTFVEKHVLGFEKYKAKLAEVTIEEVLKKTEVTIDDLENLVNAIVSDPIYALVSGTGKSRYTNGGQTERAISILPALTGSIGVSGGGYYFSDNQQTSIDVLENPNYPFEMKRSVHVGKMAEELSDCTPKIKMMWIEKANPVTSSPNVNALKLAMEKLEFIVVVEQFMTDTAQMADLVLPAAMFAEKNDLIAVYGDAYIHLLKKLIEPLGTCKSEPEIYRLLGEKMDMNIEELPLVNEETINRVLNRNGVPTTYKKLSEEPFLAQGYDHIAFSDLKFDTPSGKIEIFSEQILTSGLSPLPEYITCVEQRSSSPDLYKKYPLSFLSAHAAGRINSQFTEMNLSREKEPVIDLHIDDAELRGIKSGDRVQVFNDRGDIEVKAKVGTHIKKGTVHVYEGWGEKHHAAVNKLTIGRQTDFGHGTAFHNCLVDVKK